MNPTDTPETCLPSTGPIEVTNDNNNGWADIISNYTTQKGNAWRGTKSRCEMALIAHTQVTEGSTCRGSDDNVPVGDANSYKADCDACNETPDFTFASGLGSDACLNYFVGHIEDACLVDSNAPTDEKGAPKRYRCADC